MKRYLKRARTNARKSNIACGRFSLLALPLPGQPSAVTAAGPERRRFGIRSALQRLSLTGATGQLYLRHIAHVLQLLEFFRDDRQKKVVQRIFSASLPEPLSVA